MSSSLRSCPRPSSMPSWSVRLVDGVRFDSDSRRGIAAGLGQAAIRADLTCSPSATTSALSPSSFCSSRWTFLLLGRPKRKDRRCSTTSSTVRLLRPQPSRWIKALICRIRTVPNHIPERQRAFQVRLPQSLPSIRTNESLIKPSGDGQADPRLVHQKLPRARLYHSPSLLSSLRDEASPSSAKRLAE